MVKPIAPLTRFRSETENCPPPTNRVRPATPIAISLPDGVTLYPTELNLPPNLDLDAWEAIGVQLAKTEKGLQWALGDWWVYGNHKYGERKAAAKAKGIPYEFGSLMNLGTVARQSQPHYAMRL